jgi:hypothetical protein
MQHVSRMDDQRYPKKMLQYQPRGKRRLGRPLKRLLDDIQLQAETDHSGLNSWSHMMMMMIIMIILRCSWFKKQLNLEAKVYRFLSWTRKYWKRSVCRINTENCRKLSSESLEFRPWNFWLSEKWSNGSIIIYIFMWVIVFSNELCQV